MNDFVSKLNSWGHDGIPFLFVIDFEMKKPFACQLDRAKEHGLFFKFPSLQNSGDEAKGGEINLRAFPGSFEEYEKSFRYVTERLHYGDSFLTNLTVRTPVQANLSLSALFRLSRAKYKLLFRDEFLVFSPETFVRIENGKIFANPMKGTIDASGPDAERRLTEDPKEFAEHVTIVDLLRNDLSLVARDITVTRFRYLEKITTTRKNLFQMSSEITGLLPDDYHSGLGDILFALLPAGSVSGAPKTKTLEIIRGAEGKPRGYYTGVFGYFNGSDLDSGVMIRFIERDGDQLYYRSGGGITTQSDAHREYDEVLDKIYVPVD